MQYGNYSDIDLGWAIITDMAISSKYGVMLNSKVDVNGDSGEHKIPGGKFKQITPQSSFQTPLVPLMPPQFSS